MRGPNQSLLGITTTKSPTVTGQRIEVLGARGAESSRINSLQSARTRVTVGHLGPRGTALCKEDQSKIPLQHGPFRTITSFQREIFQKFQLLRSYKLLSSKEMARHILKNTKKISHPDHHFPAEWM